MVNRNKGEKVQERVDRTLTYIIAKNIIVDLCVTADNHMVV